MEAVGQGARGRDVPAAAAASSQGLAYLCGVIPPPPSFNRFINLKAKVQTKKRERCFTLQMLHGQR